MPTTINHGNGSRAGGRDYIENLNISTNLKPNLLFKEYFSKDLTYLQWMFLFKALATLDKAWNSGISSLSIFKLLSICVFGSLA